MFSVSRFSYKTLILILLFLLIPIVLFLRISQNNKDVYAEWWDETWMYRQSINISSHTSDETDVYITAAISLSSTDKAQTDAGDFRFLNSTGQILPYYIVSGAGTTSITFHIALAAFDAGAQTLYAYYGNPSAENGFSASDFSTQASNYTLGSQGSEEIGGGPIAYWKFDEGIGTTAYDSSSNQYDSIITGATWKTEESCISGKCLGFNGSNNYVSTNFGNGRNISDNPITISTWVNPIGIGNTIIFVGTDNGTNQRLYLAVYNGKWDMGIQSSTWGGIGPTENVDFNKWTHITLVMDGSNAKLYVNGQFSFQKAYTSYSLASNITIGRYGSSSAYSWPGLIDEVKIFPYARTADQIKADYAAGLAGMNSSSDSSVNIGGASAKFLSDGLVGYWKFDESSGNATDSSGNNNNATVSGSSNYTSGKYGNSFRAGIGATNRVTNPSFETSLTGWTDQTGGSMTQSNTTSLYGDYSVRTLGGRIYTTTSGTIGTTYTLSAWVKTDQANKARIRYELNGGNYAWASGDSTYHPGDNVWRRLTITTPELTSNTTIYFFLYNNDGVNYSYFDGTQIEVYNSSGTSFDGYATPYFDGSTGFGNTWSGTEHASISFRASSTGNVANSSSIDIGTTQISLGAWVYLNKIPQSNAVVMQKSGYTAGYRIMIKNNGTVHVGIGETGGGYTSSNNSLSLNKWHHIFSTYDGTNIRIYINGQLDKTQPYSNPLVNTTSLLYFGSTEYPPIDGYVDEVRIYNRALSPTEVKQLFEFAPGPVGYWKFDEGVGTTAFDSSGNNNHGVWQGTLGNQWTIGKIGTAGNFNGTDTYLTKTDQDTIDIKTGSSTWSLWFKTNQSTRGIMYRKSDASNTNGVLIDIGGSVAGQVKCAIHFSPSITITSSTSTYNDNKWHHLTCSLDRNNNTLKMYIDGKIGATTIDASTLSAIDLNATSNVYIGQGSGGFFNGLIDEVKIYNYPRTQKQILEDMNAGAPATSARGGPLVHYKFDEGQGSSIVNWGFGGTSLNANLGTSTSAPSWNNNGKFGKALSFSSSSNQYTYTTDGITNGPLDVGQPELTLTAWINPSSLSGTQAIINKNGPYLLWVDGVNKRLYTGLYTGTWYWLYSENNSLTTNKWQHIAMTYDGTTRKLYIDGKRSGNNDTQVSGSLMTVNSDVQIGRDTALGGRFYFDGLIDEVKIYNYALSADEVKQDYNQGSTFVFGASTQTIGTTTTSLDYCVPGDTSPCSPPVAEWKFEEGVGTTAYDTSGNNFHGIFGAGSSAPSWNNGKMGTAVYFDGTPGKHVTVSAGSGNSNNFTVQAWVKPTNYTGSGNNNDRNTILYANNKYLQIYSNGKIAVYINGLSSPGYHYSNATVPLNQWSHVAYNYNGSEIRIFINGFLDSSFPATGTPPDGWVNATIGFQDSSYQRQFDGSVDQVQIYNYARTPAQIAWSYNKGAPVGHWKMDECQGTQIADWSGNANHGTLSIGASGTQTSPGTCTTSSTAWGNGKLGKLNASLNFDGSDDYFLISQPKIQTSPNYFTVAGFIKPGNLISRFITPNSTGLDQYFTYVNTSQRLAIHIAETNDTNERDRYSTTNSVPLNTWTHFAVSINDKDIKIYINGKLDSQYTETINISGWNGNWYIGQRGNSTNWFLGQLDDLRIYNYALTATQIKTLYNNGSVNFR